MKIVHVITDLDIGGAEMMLYKLLLHMDRRRFDNVVVSMTNKGACGMDIEALGFPVVHLNMRRGIPNPVGLLRLVNLLRKEHPTILQTWLYHADLLGLLAGKLARVSSLVWNLRCSDMDMRHYSWLSRFVIWILVKLSALPTAVMVNSEAGRSFHEKLGYRPQRWVLIPNGFDLARFRPDAEARKSIRQELGLSDDTVLIGLIARYDPMKGYANFLQAAGVLLERYGGVHLVLAGRGIERGNEELEGLIRASGKGGNFHLLGERRDIPQILAALDILTSSSFGEGFPNIIGEAMACGVPCVVTDVGDSRMILGKTGRVVPAGEPYALAAAWGEMIEMGPRSRFELGTASRRRIEEHFSLSGIVARYEEFYEELASHAQHPRL